MECLTTRQWKSLHVCNCSKNEIPLDLPIYLCNIYIVQPISVRSGPMWFSNVLAHQKLFWMNLSEVSCHIGYALGVDGVFFPIFSSFIYLKPLDQFHFVIETVNKTFLWIFFKMNHSQQASLHIFWPLEFHNSLIKSSLLICGKS